MARAPDVGNVEKENGVRERHGKGPRPPQVVRASHDNERNERRSRHHEQRHGEGSAQTIRSTQMSSTRVIGGQRSDSGASTRMSARRWLAAFVFLRHISRFAFDLIVASNSLIASADTGFCAWRAVFRHSREAAEYRPHEHCTVHGGANSGSVQHELYLIIRAIDKGPGGPPARGSIRQFLLAPY